MLVPLKDGVFSIVTASLNQEHSLETPRDVERTHAEYKTTCLVFHAEKTTDVLLSRTLIQRMRPLFQKKGLRFEVELVETVPCQQPEMGLTGLDVLWGVCYACWSV